MANLRSVDTIERERQRAELLTQLRGGGGGGTSGGMEERVTRLEVHMEYVQRDLAEIKSTLAAISERLTELPTKRDLSSWQWQWIATGVAIIALTIGGVTGGLALIASYAGS